LVEERKSQSSAETFSRSTERVWKSLKSEKLHQKGCEAMHAPLVPLLFLERKDYTLMDNIRHIHLRRRWIFSGVFALLLTLMGVWLLLPAFSAHAAPVKAATGHETVTCIVTAGQKTPKCRGGQGTIFCTGGPAPSEKVGKEQGITDVVGKEQLTTVKGTKGQGPPITCTAGKK
jgi:hypothetical protein